ncbi:MAG: hypothetical protein JWL95_2983 [Gemmatimonadetes bacterium]|nr:hypothetical protein [Gemmatimonadota bacterium]
MIVPTTAPTSAHYLEIVGQVHDRLRTICIQMPTPLFDQMIERIALVQFTYEREPCIPWRIARAR